MLKSCQYCGHFHPKGYGCPKKPKRRKFQTLQTDIRSTYKWTQKSLAIRERDHYLCQVCLDEGIINYSGIGVHHIIPLEEDDGHAFDDDWLISLCGTHHEQAEAREISRERLHQLAIRGTPLPQRELRGGCGKTTRPLPFTKDSENESW